MALKLILKLKDTPENPWGCPPRETAWLGELANCYKIMQNGETARELLILHASESLWIVNTSVRRWCAGAVILGKKSWQ